MSDIIITKSNYEEKLQNLNLNIKKKNLIFDQRQFVDCIWSSEDEDLEKIICECLR